MQNVFLVSMLPWFLLMLNFELKWVFCIPFCYVFHRVKFNEIIVYFKPKTSPKWVSSFIQYNQLVAEHGCTKVNYRELDIWRKKKQ